MKISVKIGSEHKGVYASIGLSLKNEYHHDVTFIVNDNISKKLLNRMCNNSIKVIVLNNETLVTDESTIEEALLAEEKYNILLSNLMVTDRALGAGYLNNVDKTAGIKRSFYSNAYKISEVLAQLKSREKVLKNQDVVLLQNPDPYMKVVADHLNISYFWFAPIRYGNRRYWSSENIIAGNEYVGNIQKYLTENPTNLDKIKYNIEEFGVINNNNSIVSYYDAFFKALFVIYNDTKNHIRGIRKKDSYYLYGWVPSIFRNVANYKYIQKKSVRPEDIKNYKVIFFPLQNEPEVSLTYFSPEFNNTFEAISLLAKSLPSDTILLLKEQSGTFGVRSRKYYNQISKLFNVYWADPDIHSWSYIKISNIVATLTGTVQVEAVYMDKPVISFSKSNIVNYLPTVHYVKNYNDVKKAVEYILSGCINNNDFIKSKYALYNAQINSSEEFSGYVKTVRSEDLEVGIGSKASKMFLNSLKLKYTNKKE
jgi:hypothetical protein